MTKIIKNETPVSKEAILSCLNPWRLSHRGNVQVIFGAIVSKPTGLENLPPPALQPIYQKIEIDPDTHTVAVWDFDNNTDIPCVIYENAII